MSNVKVIELTDVVYDKRARDGTWCTISYDGHPHGCPNFTDKNKCPQIYPDFKTLPNMSWYAVILPFDLKKHEKEYLEKEWVKSRRQARCVLYWQKKHMNKLLDEAIKFKDNISGDCVLEVPEACGIHVYETMKLHGLELKPVNMDLDIVYKIMFVGKIV